MRRSSVRGGPFLAVSLCGASAFVEMYATQPLLPALRSVFGVGEAAVGATITVLTLGCALTAPFVGPIADRLGRKRVIVSSILLLALASLAAASATSLPMLLMWRFIQGVVMPGIFAVTLAYIAEEFPAASAGTAAGGYIAGNVFGGFLGRFVAAFVVERTGHWQNAFLALGTLTLLGGLVVLAALPSSTHFTKSTSIGASFAAIPGFLRDRVLLCVYVVGGAVLFTLIAAFTFVMFHLSQSPFGFGPLVLGNVFFVYLLGVVVTPLAGRLIDRVGHRRAALVALSVGTVGLGLMLVPTLSAIVSGLALLSCGVFGVQAASQGYVGQIVPAQRSTASALYLTFYYVGGGLGAIAPAPVWNAGGWPATVALIIVVQAVAAAVIWRGWTRGRELRQA